MTYAIVVGIGFVGFFLLLTFSGVLIATAKNSVGLLDLLLSPLSDDEKLELVPQKTMLLTKSLVGTIILVGVIFAFSIVILNQVELGGLEIVVCYSIGATIPFFIRKKSQSPYSKNAQLLHHLILDNYNLHLKLFERDVSKSRVNKRNDFLIVTGLARAGTTSMLNHLVKLGGLSSLNYANMPLVLAPKTWAKFYKPKSNTLKERSHGDGIKIGFDSNEALEEYFFKVVTNDTFINSNSLNEHDINSEQFETYLDYQALVRETDESIYIAKNNNFLLRYESLRKHNQEFTAVIMFRHPLYHAKSLMSKHAEFSSMQKEDGFMLDYMDWLGHHEFGLNHKPFKFSESTIKSKQSSPEQLDYWLEVWVNYYRKAATIEDQKIVWVSYDNFCEKPSEVIKSICNKINHKCVIPELASHTNTRTVKDSVNGDLEREAMKIYSELLKKCQS